jgi:hypothetical protein
MRLLPGDLADRQSIVELKINHCNAEFDEDNTRKPRGGVGRVLVNKNAVDVTPFLDELDMIRRALETKWVPDLVAQNKVEAYDKLYDQLNEANTQLWELEDQIRALQAAPQEMEGRVDWLGRVKDTAFNITAQNDKRARIVKEINALWGYNRQEKMY